MTFWSKDHSEECVEDRLSGTKSESKEIFYT